MTNGKKKTKWMAAIAQHNIHTGTTVHFERRVYEDEHGTRFVRINGYWFEIDWLLTHNHDVNCYF